ncbi:hypothetical protein QG37_01335 [Candidozyma auris]|uniref:Uncharacterized protein n=1 Tax=Candidozyma auris TaxID=498019 RepID=A0A0L0P5F2_CANAR|nr:hypothetical protein QG37_01335 [[Candida] auris]
MPLVFYSGFRKVELVEEGQGVLNTAKIDEEKHERRPGNKHKRDDGGESMEHVRSDKRREKEKSKKLRGIPLLFILGRCQL